MASLRRHPRSKFWIACYTARGGRRCQRSTAVVADGSVNNRRAAQKIADSYEDAAKKAQTAQQVQRVISSLFQEITGTDLPNATIEAFVKEWLERRKNEISESSYTFYQNHIDHFLRFLGDDKTKPLSSVDQTIIRRFRDAQAKRHAPGTVNHSLKILRMVFSSAKRDGIIVDLPTDNVPVLRKSPGSSRRAFTIAELKILVSHADDEWRSLILFGLYTGQRLGDLARLTWQSIDIPNNEIRFVTGKTRRQIILPIAGPLLKHIQTLKAAESKSAFVHPCSAHVVNEQGKVGTLSRQFYDLMADVGLVSKKAHRKAKEPDEEGVRRGGSEISFHALRHTATSLMKNAGISPAIVEEFIGHDSKEIIASTPTSSRHRLYAQRIHSLICWVSFCPVARDPSFPVHVFLVCAV